MGHIVSSSGKNAAEKGFIVEKHSDSDKVIALAGNPNVGKSTVFNALTGMNQHTGNWPGKTVATAQGTHHFKGRDYILVDLPGTYSLMAHSAEEEVARDFLLYGAADAAIVVCDATCLERSLNLVFQTMEIMTNVVVCVNLLDEAAKKGIKVNLEALEKELGVPVVGTSARSGTGLRELIEKTGALAVDKMEVKPRKVRYPRAVQEALALLEPPIQKLMDGRISSCWLALRLLEHDETTYRGVEEQSGINLSQDKEITAALEKAGFILLENDITPETLRDRVVRCLVLAAEEVCMEVVPCVSCTDARDRKLDRVLTSKLTGIPIMLLLLSFIFWLTITGANYPSQVIASGLFWIQDRLTDLFMYIGAPDWLHGALVLGVYRVLAWVVSVMLPPMAIFFPLFTLLEDFGYLPRVAFNLDHQFRKANACGKQALTMWIG